MTKTCKTTPATGGDGNTGTDIPHFDVRPIEKASVNAEVKAEVAFAAPTERAPMPTPPSKAAARGTRRPRRGRHARPDDRRHITGDKLDGARTYRAVARMSRIDSMPLADLRTASAKLVRTTPP